MHRLVYVSWSFDQKFKIMTCSKFQENLSGYDYTYIHVDKEMNGQKMYIGWFFEKKCKTITHSKFQDK